MSTQPNGPLILLVDDQLSIRQLVKRQLEAAGYQQIEEAASGMEAISKLKEKLFDLVILDWSMPQMTGIEVLKEIRKNPEYNQLKVMMLTAEGFRENVLEAIQAGANNYVVKPFDQGTLLAKVNLTLINR